MFLFPHIRQIEEIFDDVLFYGVKFEDFLFIEDLQKERLLFCEAFRDIKTDSPLLICSLLGRQIKK